MSAEALESSTRTKITINVCAFAFDPEEHFGPALGLPLSQPSEEIPPPISLHLTTPTSIRISAQLRARSYTKSMRLKVYLSHLHYKKHTPTQQERILNPLVAVCSSCKLVLLSKAYTRPPMSHVNHELNQLKTSPDKTLAHCPGLMEHM